MTFYMLLIRAGAATKQLPQGMLILIVKNSLGFSYSGLVPCYHTDPGRQQRVVQVIESQPPT